MNDLEALALRLAGDKAYKDGTLLFTNGAVTQLTVALPKITAIVQSHATNQVELTLSNGIVDGSCNCEVSEGFDFCGHCVAALLTYQKRLLKLEAASKGNPEERLKAYLDSLSPQDIKAGLLRVVLSSSELQEHWLTFADLASGKLVPSDLKKSITKALPLKDIWRHDKVKLYFASALSLLHRLFEVIDSLSVQDQFELCAFALARYDKILERIDDAGGHRFGVLALLERKYASAFKRLDMNVSEKADFLLQLFDTQYIHFELSGLPDKFINADDADLLLAFYGLLQQWVEKNIVRYEKTKISNKIAIKRKVNALNEYLYSRKQFALYLKYRIYVSETLDDYIDVVNAACLADDFSTAKHYLEVINGLAKSPQDEEVVAKLGLDVSLAQKDDGIAIVYAWEYFSRSLNIETIELIKRLQGEEGQQNVRVFQKAEEILLSKIQAHARISGSKEPSLLVESLAELYIRNNCADKALALNHQYELPMDTQHDIAQASLEHRPKAAFNLYRQLCLLYPQLGSNKDYQSCIDLLDELRVAVSLYPELKDRFNHLLAELFDLYRHKTSFIELLQEHFSNTRS
ncbi:hypothetical protein KJ365_10070 [Glaciecola sp. XM2]|uniref:SWIM zinc finger family protein n=1 Tax=Glaciecola sp. XM2 TaxID=1914931 RepID=UPI001BDDF7D9|nr:hypothetical protein [Glaciecola sp. XM2]MBT1451221.1 hypothetical protein [Glaciecola sp. XM2]